MDVIFYLLGLLQKSFWIIDIFWSIFPQLYGLIWLLHPVAEVNTRTIVANVLTWIWAIRLTHSYFRREEWKFGEREDWRYTKMAIDYGRPCWYFAAFWLVGVA